MDSRCLSVFLETPRTNHRRLQEYCVHAEVTRLRKFRSSAKSKQRFRTTIPMQNIISRDGCLRMEPIPALGLLWDTVIDALEPVAQGDEVRTCTRNKRGKANGLVEDVD